jgi:hypothetical protein
VRRFAAAALAALACLASAGCGESESGDTDAARYLDPRSDAVLAVDLDYDSPNWEQIKRLYA